MAYLSEKYPGRDFYLIAGADNFESFHKWKNYEVLLDNYKFLIYPRYGFEPGKYLEHPSINLVNAPVIEISSSFIRDAIRAKKDVRYFLPSGIYDYILEMHFYE
jgi:nicotinate-nucleotide adenylyltransferase